MSLQQTSVDSAAGYSVPLDLAQPVGPAHSVVVILPALGIGARFYHRLALALVDAGHAAVVMEPRGHGRSALRPSRHVDYGFADILCQDLPAVLDLVERSWPGVPTVLLGHSLGGHLAAMASALYPQRMAGVVLCGCGSPWYRAYPWPQRGAVQGLSLLVALTARGLGYFPGHRLGFGGREARQLMRDWRHLARHNRYQGRNLPDDLDARLGQSTLPLLALWFAADAFAPSRAVRAVTGKFPAACVTTRRLDADALGTTADHYAWARRPAAVVAALDCWWATADRREA